MTTHYLRDVWRGPPMGLLAALISGPGVASAADGADTLQVGESSIEEVVVTARRIEETAQSVPISIAVTTGRQLQEANVKDLQQLQNVTPGMNIRPNTSDVLGSLVQIRGQGTSDSTLVGDPAVGTYVDGIYIPRISGLSLILSQSQELSRVEVLRGPQGTLFGRNTSGGAVSVVTLAPKPEFGAYVSGSYGNYDTVDVQAGVNLPISDTVAIRASAMQLRRNGYVRDGRGVDLNDLDAQQFRLRATAEVTDKLSLDLSGYYQHAKSNGVAYKLKELCGDPGVNCPAMSTPNGSVIGGRITTYVATLPVAFGGLGLPAGCVTQAEGSAGCPAGSRASAKFAQAAALLRSFQDGSARESDSTTNERTGATLGVVSFQAAYAFTDSLTLKSISGFVKTGRNSHADQDGTPFRVVDPAVPNQSKTWSQELQLVGVSGPLDWIVGGYASEEKGAEKGVSAQLVNPAATVINYSLFQGDVKNTSQAAFGQVNWQVAPRFRVTGGLRYTRDSRGLVSRNLVGPDGVTNEDVPIIRIDTSVNPPVAVPAAPYVQCNIPVALLDSPNVCRAHLKETYSKVSWLASADWKVAEDALLYARVSTGYKAGGLQLRGTNVPVTYDPYNPETSIQYEAGFKATFWDRKARINASAWLTDYDDIQRSVVVPNGFGGITNLQQNAAKARLHGLELDGSFVPAEGLTLTVGGSYFKGKYLEYTDGNVDRTDQPYALGNGGAPKFTYVLGVRYVAPLPVGDLIFNVNWRYQTKTLAFTEALTPTSNICCNVRVDPSRTEYVPGFGDLSARMTLELDDLDASVSLFGANLTNEVVYQPASDVFSIGFRAQIAQAPRTFGVQFVKRFD